MIVEIMPSISASDITAVTAAAAAIALVIATVYLAYVTKRYVELTKELVQTQTKLFAAQTNPLVYIDLEERKDGLFKVFAKNIGGNPAQDIRFEAESFQLVTDAKDDRPISFSMLPAVQSGLKGLAPGYEKTIAFVEWGAATRIGKAVDVTLKHKNILGDLKTETYALDFHYYVQHLHQIYR